MGQEKTDTHKKNLIEEKKNVINPFISNSVNYNFFKKALVSALGTHL